MFVFFLVACAHPDAVAVPALVPAPRFGGMSMPVEARLEGMATPGECAADADCATAGCSAEVCVATERAPDVVTTCEILPVYSELKACTCQSGECRWVREAGARALGVPRLLPGGLPTR